MKLTRRSLLRLAAAGAVAPLLPACAPKGGEASGTTSDSGRLPTPTGGPEPSPWDAPGAEDATVFPSGLRTGDASTTAAVVSVRTTEPGFTLVVMEATGETWAEVDRVPVEAADGGAIVVLDGLAADTAYALAAYVDDTRRSSVGRLRTAAVAARIVRFGATSCLGDEQPEQAPLASVAADQLDFFCFLGDFVYADGSRTLEGYRAFYDAQLARPNVRAALDSTSIAATWDDHEVTNNWSWEQVDQAWYDAALGAFRETLPQGAGPTGGLWRKLSWGETLDVFVLDCRSERRDGRYISAEQMAWLQEGLAASGARFKFILNSVPITNLQPMFGPAEIDDRWDGYPDDRSAILDFIAEQGVTGVVWICGDVHFGAVTHVDPPGGVAAEAWEVFVGPSGSLPMYLVDAYPLDEQFVWLTSAWNWARFTCDPGTGEVTVEHVGSDGSVLHQVVLRP